MNLLIKNGTIVNNGLSFKGSLLIAGHKIAGVYPEDPKERKTEAPEKMAPVQRDIKEAAEGKAGLPDNRLRVLDASGLHIFPGVIDDQVHFREPGNTGKATIASESAAAVLGGVTSFMDMPNNDPPAVTNRALEEKYRIAARDSFANYSFYMGATNRNLEEIRKVNKTNVCGIKVFMGSSTGNMLVDDPAALENIFKYAPVPIAAHCEEEEIVRKNLQEHIDKYGERIPFDAHPDIRSREACIRCTERALSLAIKNRSRLHVLHISTAEEIEMIRQARAVHPGISAEVCVHYMWFNRENYSRFGSRIKCNPAIKEKSDMEAIRRGVKEGIIKVVATDHAPHLKAEKENPYLKAPSGLPLIQHSLQLMLDLAAKGIFTLEDVAARMSHGPAECFNVRQRGYIEEEFFADLVLVDLQRPDSYSPLHPAYKCGWSPFAGHTFASSIIHTFVNGEQVVENGKLTGAKPGMRLEFDR